MSTPNPLFDCNFSPLLGKSAKYWAGPPVYIHIYKSGHLNRGGGGEGGGVAVDIVIDLFHPLLSHVMPISKGTYVSMHMEKVHTVQTQCSAATEMALLNF